MTAPSIREAEATLDRAMTALAHAIAERDGIDLSNSKLYPDHGARLGVTTDLMMMFKRKGPQGDGLDVLCEGVVAAEADLAAAYDAIRNARRAHLTATREAAAEAERPVPARAGTDHWIMVHDLGSDRLLRFKVSTVELLD